MPKISRKFGERTAPAPPKCTLNMDIPPPIDHYQFYKRADLSNSVDSPQMSEAELDGYREQIARFEHKMAYGDTLERETFQPNDSQIFQMDYEYAALAADQLLSPGRNSEDSEGMDTSQIDSAEKVQELMRDILHKNYGSHKQSENDKTPQEGKKSTVYPASQPFVKLSLYSDEVKQIEEYTNTREIGHLGHWAVSSCKANHGVQHLRDLELDTYWQSEGQQPHLISARFPIKMHFAFLRFYVDEPSDESYTPEKIAVRVGTNEHDLKEVMVEDIKDLTSQTGGANWIYCSLDTTPESPENAENAAPKISREPFVPPTNDIDHTHHAQRRTYETAFMIQLAILANHQNGRDTHIRQVQIFSPLYHLDKGYRMHCDRLGQLKRLQQGHFDSQLVGDTEEDAARQKQQLHAHLTAPEEFKTVALTKFSSFR